MSRLTECDGPTGDKKQGMNPSCSDWLGLHYNVRELIELRDREKGRRGKGTEEPTH